MNNKLTDFEITMKEEFAFLRTLVGLSQGELASVLGVTRQTVSSAETGKKVAKRSTLLAFYAILTAYANKERKVKEMIKFLELEEKLQKMIHTGE